MSNADESLLDSAQVAQMLGIKTQTLFSWRARRPGAPERGPQCVRRGRRVFYTPEAVYEFVDTMAGLVIPSRAARLLGVSTTCVGRMIRTQKLAAREFQGRRYVVAGALIDELARRGVDWGPA